MKKTGAVIRATAAKSRAPFKARASDIRGIGATLQVDTAIEGSLRRQGDLLRIHIQLVNTRDGCYLWAGKYERHLTGVFQLQEEIAAAIAECSTRIERWLPLRRRRVTSQFGSKLIKSVKDGSQSASIERSQVRANSGTA